MTYPDSQIRNPKCAIRNSAALRSSLPTARCFLLTTFCLLLLLITHHSSLITVFAQSATATLSGTVEDQNGAIIPGANVTVVNDSTKSQRQVTTNDHGDFTVPLLPPSTYTVSVERQGFAPIQIKNVILNVGDQKALQIQLKAGDVNATVQVMNEAELIRTDAGVGTVVDRQFVSNIPLNGRSFQGLIALTPGVVLTKATETSPGQFSVNGQRPNSNYFTVDGVSANIAVTPDTILGQTGAGSVPGFSIAGGTNNLVSIDALEEFKVQTSTYAPEFGRTPGGQISIITRSGTNQFHGTAFDYFRNDVLDANDWFANRNGLTKPRERQNDFGGTFSGPVLLPHFGQGGSQPGYNGRNRTFFFFSYEGLRLRQPLTGISEVPSEASRQTAPPSIAPFLNAFPHANGPATSNGLALFSASFSVPTTLNATSIRIDHVFGRKLTAFGRYNYAPSETISRGLFGGTLSDISPTKLTTRTLTVAATFVVSPSVSNEFRANWSWNRGQRSNDLDTLGGAVPIPLSQMLPSTFSPKGNFAFILGTTLVQEGFVVDNLQRQINLLDNLSAVHRTHQLKFGVDYRRLSPEFVRATNIGAAFFAGATGALTGKVRLGVIQASAGPKFLRINNFSAYGQDTWRATRRLTLTYGLRWDVDGYPSERNGNFPTAVSGLDNPSTMTLAPQGTRLWQTTYNNFAPRAGVAYKLSEARGRETVVRGGFGLFYDLLYGTVLNSFSNSWPSVVNKFLPAGTQFPFDATAAALPSLSRTPPAGQIWVTDPNLKLPYTYEWNIAVERSLGSSQTISASYIGAAGRRLLRQEQLTKPNPTFTTLFVTRNTATSDYHAMQLQYNRRLSKGIQAIASYTWSHSIDTASNDSASLPAAAIVNPNVDRGPSDFDVRHTFTAAVTYSPAARTFGTVLKAVLRGWSIDPIFTARSATPVNVTTTTDVLGVGVSSVSRPDLIQGAPLYITDPTVAGGRRFNRAAFSIPPANSGRQGTLGRNALRGFPVYQIDLALRRRFSLTERVKLQFSSEFFNIFNHPNFADPQGSLGSNGVPNALFGQSTTMLGRSLGSGGLAGGFSPLYQIGGPRSIQFALKLSF